MEANCQSQQTHDSQTHLIHLWESNPSALHLSQVSIVPCFLPHNILCFAVISFSRKTSEGFFRCRTLKLSFCRLQKSLTIIVCTLIALSVNPLMTDMIQFFLAQTSNHLIPFTTNISATKEALCLLTC